MRKVLDCALNFKGCACQLIVIFSLFFMLFSPVIAQPTPTPLPPADFGDVPDPTYPTLLASNGAYHIIGSGTVRLGSNVDAEPDGQPHPLALGDDINGLSDDDGVHFTTFIVPGETATLLVISSTYGYLNAWIDFNNNGSWADSGEHAIQDSYLFPGLTWIYITIPANAIGGTYFYSFPLYHISRFEL